MEENKDDKLRHRIHQWSVPTLIELLEEKPIHVAKISERGSSSKDPFSGSRIGRYPPMIHIAVKRVKRIRVVKIILRIASVDGVVLERRC